MKFFQPVAYGNSLHPNGPEQVISTKIYATEAEFGVSERQTFKNLATTPRGQAGLKDDEEFGIFLQELQVVEVFKPSECGCGEPDCEFCANQ